MKVTKKKYNDGKATLKFKGEYLGISCDEYWQMCLDLYAKIGYVNGTDILVHGRLNMTELLQFRDET